LNPDPTPKGSILHIVFQHPDKEIPQAVLTELVSLYIAKSAEEHKVGISPEFLEGEVKRQSEDLKKLQQELQKEKQSIGVVSSIDETRRDHDSQMDSIKKEIMEAEASMAEHLSNLKEAGKATNTVVSDTNSTNLIAVTNIVEQKVPRDIQDDYKRVCDKLIYLRARQFELLKTYTSESYMVKLVDEQMVPFLEQKKKFELDYPGLQAVAAITAPIFPGQPQPAEPVAFIDVAKEGQEIRKLDVRTNFLHGQLAQLQTELNKVDEKEPKILDLQNRIMMQEGSLESYLKNQYQYTLDSAGKNATGIKVNDPPSPAAKTRSKKFKKLLGMALGGGIAAGLGLAFAIEMFLDRSIKRPAEIERKLHLPVFISIPDISSSRPRATAQLPAKNRLLLKASNGEALVPAGKGPAGANGDEIQPWDRDHKLHKFYAGLRERLIVNFEVRNLTHNPKLVAVTSCGKGAGVSSIAAGLAASLSETGDGNVLLVDMNGEEGAAQHFHQGKPGCGLDAALGNDTRNDAHVQDHLYVAKENGDASAPRNMPKRFANLMPKLKASDYDYIIFDMPPVTQTSTTPRLAGLMDQVLLVIESEKTNRDTVQRATALLTESKAHVSTVLNKTRSYIPKKLHQEFRDTV
jgi:succinoglycan biosynthesis transport protein ExoP